MARGSRIARCSWRVGALLLRPIRVREQKPRASWLEWRQTGILSTSFVRGRTGAAPAGPLCPRRARLGLAFPRRRLSSAVSGALRLGGSARGGVDALVPIVPADAIPRRGTSDRKPKAHMRRARLAGNRARADIPRRRDGRLGVLLRAPAPLKQHCLRRSFRATQGKSRSSWSTGPTVNWPVLSGAP